MHDFSSHYTDAKNILDGVSLNNNCLKTPVSTFYNTHRPENPSDFSPTENLGAPFQVQAPKPGRDRLVYDVFVTTYQIPWIKYI